MANEEYFNRSCVRGRRLGHEWENNCKITHKTVFRQGFECGVAICSMKTPLKMSKGGKAKRKKPSDFKKQWDEEKALTCPLGEDRLCPTLSPAYGCSLSVEVMQWYW
jgi:hypothetical protein